MRLRAGSQGEAGALLLARLCHEGAACPRACYSRPGPHCSHQYQEGLGRWRGGNELEGPLSALSSVSLEDVFWSQSCRMPNGCWWTWLQGPLLQDSLGLQYGLGSEKRCLFIQQTHGLSVSLSLGLPAGKRRGRQGQAKGKSVHLASWVSECRVEGAADQESL